MATGPNQRFKLLLTRLHLQICKDRYSLPQIARKPLPLRNDLAQICVNQRQIKTPNVAAVQRICSALGYLFSAIAGDTTTCANFARGFNSRRLH